MNAYISADIQFYMSTLSDLIDNLENISSLNYVLSSEINLLLSEIFITNFQVQPLQAECQLLLSQLQNVGAINKYDEDSYISFHPQLQFLFQTELLSKPILFAFFLFQLAGLLDSKQHLDECKFASLGKYIIQGKQVLNVYSVQFSALLKDFYAQIPIQTIQYKIFKIRKQLEQEPNIICFHKLAKVLYRFMKGRVKTKDENEDQFLYCLVFKQLNSNTLTELFKEQTYVFNQISQIQNIWTKMDKQVIQQYENDTIIQKERITAEILIFEEELQIFKNETDSEEKRLFDRLIIQYKPHKLNRTIINNLLIKYGYKLYLNNCEYTKVYKQCEQDTFINDLILSLNGLDNAIKINNLQTLFYHQQIRDSFELIKKLVSNYKMLINLCQQPNIDRFLNQCVQLQLEDEVLKICAINIEQFSECYDLDAIIRNQLYMHKIVNRVKKPMLKLETSKIELQKIEEQKLEELKVQQQTLQQQKIEQQKLEKEQLKQHKLERLEQDKLEKLKLQQLKIEQQKLQQQKIEQQKLEQKLLEQQKIEQKKKLELEQKQKLEQLKLEQLKQEQLQQEKHQKEKLEQQILEQKLKLEQEEKKKHEQKKFEEEKLERLRQEQQKLEQQEKENMQQMKLEQEKLEQEKQELLEQQKLDEQLKLEQLEQEKVVQLKLQQEKEEQDKQKLQEQEAMMKLEQEKQQLIEQQKLEQEKLDQLRQQQLELEQKQKQEQEKLEQKRQEQLKIEQEKLELEQLENQRFEQEKLEQQKQQQLEQEQKLKQEQEQLQLEQQLKLEQEKLEQQKLEQLELERKEQEQLEQEKLENERLEQEQKLQSERLELEKQEQEKLENEQQCQKLEQDNNEKQNENEALIQNKTESTKRIKIVDEQLMNEINARKQQPCLLHNNNVFNQAYISEIPDVKITTFQIRDLKTNYFLLEENEQETGCPLRSVNVNALFYESWAPDTFKKRMKQVMQQIENCSELKIEQFQKILTQQKKLTGNQCVICNTEVSFDVNLDYDNQLKSKMRENSVSDFEIITGVQYVGCQALKNVYCSKCAQSKFTYNFIIPEINSKPIKVSSLGANLVYKYFRNKIYKNESIFEHNSQYQYEHIQLCLNRVKTIIQPCRAINIYNEWFQYFDPLLNLHDIHNQTLVQPNYEILTLLQEKLNKHKKEICKKHLDDLFIDNKQWPIIFYKQTLLKIIFIHFLSCEDCANRLYQCCICRGRFEHEESLKFLLNSPFFCPSCFGMCHKQCFQQHDCRK
ncbi:Conserved_hypothetical protein [Hexamita inflata]|uniref:Rubicon Homology domain-containing protein n=1 Tax=Hexamita inflata TaxID=28002 RepID=A0AA86Q4N3_9EUKA|nr:Conserved hypothetical protein [Hexamita inflata]